jgi:hypothetical protein
MLQLFQYLDEAVHLSVPPNSPSVNLDACLRKALLNEYLSNFVSMIALKEYQVVFSGSTTSTIALELSSKTTEVDTLGVNPLDDSSGLTPLPCFEADLYKLLFHANGAADAKILWETARRADFRHYGILKLLELVTTR